MSEPKPEQDIEPGQQAYVDWMGDIAKDIAHYATQGRWMYVELRTAQLLKMCELRRQRLQSS